MTRRQASSQARVKSSYAPNDENLSQSSLTASTWDSSGRLRSPLSCRLYGGSANTRSTEPAGNFDIPATQSPTTIRVLGSDSNLVRGAFADAPRCDTTMTQLLVLRRRCRRRGTKQPTGDTLTGQIKNRLNR